MLCCHAFAGVVGNDVQLILDYFVCDRLVVSLNHFNDKTLKPNDVRLSRHRALGSLECQRVEIVIKYAREGVDQ